MYLAELRHNWQALLAAAIGLGLGSALNHYTLSLFGPPLLADFGWSRAQFALLGSLPLLLMLTIPFAGRYTDRFGTRAAAITGFVALPLGFLAFASMRGSLIEFFAIWTAQHVFGILTTSLVYCRVVVERFDAARGIALSLVMTMPPLVGAIAAPLLGHVIDTEGWRTGYLSLAGVSALGGVFSVALMGRGRRAAAPVARGDRQLGRAELVQLLRHPTLLLVIGGMVLVNVPQVFASSQLKLVLLDAGVTAATATYMVSLYALGVIIGRFASGLALDRIKPHLVAIAALGLPAIGYLILAAGAGTTVLVGVAIALVGLAQGAESDVGAYLISRRFDMKNFSLLLSFVTAAIGVVSVIGSLVLSVSLHGGRGYSPFLLVSAIATILGAALLGLTGTRRARAGTQDEDVDKAVLEQAIAGELG